ncbi:SIS domain-containing protein [Sphingomonas sp.]|uniref:SIS domain-containing protein n=1 Tax=Sphingomonas sp. TaxID=28214 RepID=UPI003B002F32
MTSRMFLEAAAAASVVARQLAANRAATDAFAAKLRADPPHVVATCARGSSDHAATYLKHLVETRAGVLVTSASPSVSSVYHAAPAMVGALAIGLSQSGKSPDLLATMTSAKAAGARTLALVNVADSPLAALADTTLPLHAGAETSVAATKSFIALLAAAAALVAAWTQDSRLSADLDGLPDLLGRAWTSDWTPLVDALADARGLYVIGRGPGFGIAQEAALKLKETCGLHAEAFSAAEVRHGPMALVGPELPLLVFRQDDASAAGIDALVADALANGARVLVAGDRPLPGADHLFVPSAEPILAPIAAIQAFYRAADALAHRRGLDPDRPPHLNKVTETV